MPRRAATAGRRCALALLGERRRRGARARDLMRGSEALSALPERDRTLATRLVMGATAAEGALDRAIDAHLRRGAHLEPKVRDALRLAVFELCYLGTRADVCVSQGVELVRGASPRAAGLANAVLHRVAEKDAPAVAAARERVRSGSVAARDLATAGALPLWLCERALSSLGAEGAAAWALRALEPAGAWVAANRARLSVETAERLLAEAGCAPQAGPAAGSFLLGRPAALARSGLVDRVDVLPCDLSAQEVALAAAPAPGERVLEVGQGRGTKTVLLEGAAVAAGGPCPLVAVEVDEGKSQLAARRVRRAGLGAHVRCACADGRSLDASYGEFDLVFLDAPCTGTGTLARHPETAWSLAESAPAELAALQLELLRAAAGRVAAGGRLVYATCSVLAEENDRVIEAFLAGPEGASFSLVSSGLVSRPDADAHYCARLARA